jgi:hypothetical protein
MSETKFHAHMKLEASLGPEQLCQNSVVLVEAIGSSLNGHL